MRWIALNSARGHRWQIDADMLSPIAAALLAPADVPGPERVKLGFDRIVARPGRPGPVWGDGNPVGRQAGSPPERPASLIRRGVVARTGSAFGVPPRAMGGGADVR